MKTRVIVAAIIVLAAAATATGYWYFNLTDARPDGVVPVSGNIEVTDAEVSFKIAGRVETRAVDEGELVEKGDLVAELDSSDLKCEVSIRLAELEQARTQLAELEAGSRDQEIAAAEAAMRKARAALAVLEEGSRRQEIARAEAAVSSAAVERDRLAAEFARAKELFERKAISAEEFDRAKAAYEVAIERLREATEQFDLVKEGPRQQRIEEARAALDEATSRYELVQAGPRVEAIDRARAKVAQAEVRLGYATLVSPLTGIVLSEHIEPGEYVAPGTPVVTVGELEHVWLRAYIDEPDLGRVKIGQAARVTTDTYPDKVYEGRVSFVSSEAEFTPKTVQTERERVKLVYRIKIDVPNPKMELLPGMPADAAILVESAPEAEPQAPSEQ
jgi:HlyD family secretion protein